MARRRGDELCRWWPVLRMITAMLLLVRCLLFATL